MRVVPVAEIGDEVKDRVAKVFGFRLDGTKSPENGPGLTGEVWRTQGVAWIGEQAGQQDGPTCPTGTRGGPDMQSWNVRDAGILLSAGEDRHTSNREIYFGQAFA